MEVIRSPELVDYERKLRDPNDTPIHNDLLYYIDELRNGVHEIRISDGNVNSESFADLRARGQSLFETATDAIDIGYSEIDMWRIVLEELRDVQNSISPVKIEEIDTHVTTARTNLERLLTG